MKLWANGCENRDYQNGLLVRVQLLSFPNGRKKGGNQNNGDTIFL
jgi:hypothetical protein